MVALPYGRVPYPLDLAGHVVRLVEPALLPPPPGLDELLDAALDSPIGRPRIETMVRPNARVTVIVSDATRNEPRAAFLDALRRRLPSVRWTVAIATGTHGPAGVEALGIPADVLAGARIVDHDGHDDRDLVTLGVTARGTPARVHRCLVDADLVVATGCIRPHYFAGFGAGVKAIFPGLGAAHAIRLNHQLKRHPAARAGIVDGNPCREDLEEAAGLLETPTFLLDGVCGPDDRVHAVVAGDPIRAFRVGADLARPWFTVKTPRAALVIASDTLPITSSLYQSAKIAAAVAPLVEPGGTLLLVAECADGTGPLDIVNEAIFRIGVLPRLAPGVRIRLVSSLAVDIVCETLVEPCESVAVALTSVSGPILIVPRASQLLCEVTS